MKRFYLIHESAWESEVQFAWTRGPLWHSFQGKGCCWWSLGDGWRIVSGDFKSEDREHAFNSHAAVVHLHHPVSEKTLPLADLLTAEHAHKRFRQEHLDLLASAVKVAPSDTLEQLNQKIAALHPGCVIYPVAKSTSRWLY